jgi:hypothetical protein
MIGEKIEQGADSGRGAVGSRRGRRFFVVVIYYLPSTPVTQ